MASSEQNLVFGPVGHCIYCGSTEDLTREHVMPYGMHGEMVLLQCSCASCTKITGAIDNFILSKTLVDLRVRYNLKSRKKKNNSRPKQFKIKFDNGDDLFTDERLIDSDKLPWFAYALPKYDYPGYLRQVSPEEAKKNDQLKIVLSKFDAQSLLEHGNDNPVSYQFGPIDVSTFNRFLAKIAHSYASSIIGAKAFEPFLQELIIDGSIPNSYMIGCEEEEPEAPYLFEIGLSNCHLWHGQECYVVRIRLFSFLGTPTYIVVVGEPKNNVRNDFRNHFYSLPVNIKIVDEDGSNLFSFC